MTKTLYLYIKKKLLEEKWFCKMYMQTDLEKDTLEQKLMRDEYYSKKYEKIEELEKELEELKDK